MRDDQEDRIDRAENIPVMIMGGIFILSVIIGVVFFYGFYLIFGLYALVIVLFLMGTVVCILMGLGALSSTEDQNQLDALKDFEPKGKEGFRILGRKLGYFCFGALLFILSIGMIFYKILF